MEMKERREYKLLRKKTDLKLEIHKQPKSIVHPKMGATELSLDPVSS